MSAIEDGKGTGNQAEVDSKNRLQVRSTTESEDLEALKKGNHYALTSGQSR